MEAFNIVHHIMKMVESEHTVRSVIFLAKERKEGSERRLLRALYQGTERHDHSAREESKNPC